jgi:four helix bundle protein
MNVANTYQELDVWRLCEEIRVLVMAATETGAATKDRKFCDQIRDAAEDAVSDIAEGFARFKPREFAQFLGYAIASTAEVRERTRFAHGRKYFSDSTAAKVTILCVRADKAMRSLRRYLWSVSPEDVPYHPAARPSRSKRRRRTRQKDVSSGEEPQNPREEPS